MAQINVTGGVKVTGDCGHQFEIPIGGIDGDIECPTCGRKDRLPEDQVASIRAQVHKAATEFGVEQVRKELDQALRGIAGRSKHFTYRPKR